MRPPFKTTNKILSLCTEIAKFVGQYEGILSPIPEPKLRKQNQIKTIQGSLSIEGNSLTFDQMTAILDEKRVAGKPEEISEVKNAIRAYGEVRNWRHTRRKDFLKAHSIMMSGLIQDAGKYRTKNVGIINKAKVRHIAPKPAMVHKLMEELFDFLKNDKETLPLIKSCVFHYELEFIHPFSDGNGRMGRLWQHVILLFESPIFYYIPFESVIKAKQKEYYRALSNSDKAGNSTEFIEFCLGALRDGLAEFMGEIQSSPLTAKERLQYASQKFSITAFARKEYINQFKTISTATASRDLAIGVQSGQLIKIGKNALTKYIFVTFVKK